MKPYFLLLAKHRYTATKRFAHELKTLGIPYDIANYQHIRFESSNKGLKIFINDQPITKYTHIIRKNVETAQELNIRYILSEYCEMHKIRFLNAKFLLKMPYYNKLSQLAFMSENSIPYLPTIYLTTGRYEEYTTKLGKSPFGFPLILKGHTGRVGKQVFLIKNQSELNTFLHKKVNKRTLMLQQFSPLKEDFRLILVNKKVIGGWRRKAIETFKTTAGQNEKWLYDNPKPEERKIAEKIASLLDADYCAVDMMYWNNKPYVLEVNLNAGFKVYEEELKAPTNVAKTIIDVLLK